MAQHLSRCGVGYLLALALFAVDVAAAGAQKPKEPKWTHAFDLMVRKFGEDTFTEKTQKFGVEVFKDPNTGFGVYICQTGFLAVAPGFENIHGVIDKSLGAKWVSGLDLPARKPGEKMFTKDTKSWSMETFFDPNTLNWVYITEQGVIAVTPGKAPPSGGLKAPIWIHSVDLKCRKGGQRDWKDAPSYGLEVYKDNNTNNLIYISHTGFIAVIPEPPDAKYPPEAKAPDWIHGLDLSCRKSTEKDFTKDTRKWGIEVFLDSHTGNLIYIAETGTLAVVPAKKDTKVPTPAVKEPVWTHGLNLSARKVGQKDFDEKTQVYGSEVFRDDNTGAIIYIAETGSISAITK